MKKLILLALSGALVSCAPLPKPTSTLPPVGTPVAQPVPDGPQKRGDILVIGDSQISFGAGAAYQSFFENLGGNCGVTRANWVRPKAAAIGVRSTALLSWTTDNGPEKATLCDVDPKFGVNAGTYGISSQTGRTFVQIGKDPDYPFCTAGRSGLQALFDSPRYEADLVVLAFLGNDSSRWQSAANAAQDVTTAAAQIPQQTGCILLSTMPVYDKASNDKRAVAQANFARAAGQTRCSVVQGHTPATRKAIEGKTEFFRTNADGKVIDTSHANEAASQRFVRLIAPQLCAAVRAQTGQ